MAKYSEEFKIHVVNEYMKGPLGYKVRIATRLFNKEAQIIKIANLLDIAIRL
ncbi:hypothetical protein [Lysinibacillus fusiformis]|uniref:hypothetical protein n=1 Tax=Lysinibacillus fusiformis TaxID=28031 RepID=UPI002E21AE5E|nr:hypothetical protein [Lysinibacillus fusiformis]